MGVHGTDTTNSKRGIVPLGTWAPPVPHPDTAVGTQRSEHVLAQSCPLVGTQVQWHPRCCPGLMFCWVLGT